MRILALLLALLMAAPLGAARTGLRSFSLGSKDGKLLVEFYLRNAFPEGLEESLKAGVPLICDFSLRLYRRRAWWPDKRILNCSFRHRLFYDNLKGVYSLVLEEEGRTLSFKSLEEAKAQMARVCSLPLTRIEDLKSGHYRLKLKAKIGLKRPHLWPFFFLKSLFGLGKRTISYLCEFTIKGKRLLLGLQGPSFAEVR